MKLISLDDVLRICEEGQREKSPNDDIYRLIGKVDYNAALDHVARLVEGLEVHDLPEDADYIIRQDAIKAWNKRADDYIPVIEKVPKWGQRCLILGSKGGLYLGKYLDGGFYDDRGKWINTAVAWKPVINREGEVL